MRKINQTIVGLLATGFTLSGCAVVSVTSAVVGTTFSVGSAVVGTAVTVGSTIVGTTVDVASAGVRAATGSTNPAK